MSGAGSGLYLKRVRDDPWIKRVIEIVGLDALYPIEIPGIAGARRELRESIWKELVTGVVTNQRLGVVGRALAMGAAPAALRLARTEMKRAHQQAGIDARGPGEGQGVGAE